MKQEIKDRIGGLVTTQVLFDFCQATKALWRDLRCSGEEFNRNDIYNFIQAKMDQAMTEAEVEGPLKIEDNPLLADAVKYAKRRLFDGASQKCAEHEATALYNLDDEAVRVMKRLLETR